MNWQTMFRVAAGVILFGAAAKAEKPWTTTEESGRIEIARGGTPLFAWQRSPLSSPKGGGKFAGSAFIHPLRTPSGFVCTALQPDDHKHHFGLWWPWKFIEVDGATYNTWEIQQGQGAHYAREARPAAGTPDRPSWELLNETVIRKPGAEPLPVIRETTLLAAKVDGDALVLDFSIAQKASGAPVKIINHHYSGFTWRGPLTWNKDNSVMTTSAGKNRENANGTAARWVVVSGPAPGGHASVLMMSAAETPDHVRVWNASAMNGNPFVNFNPVLEKPLPLDDAHPAVSKRRYRVIAADHAIHAGEAETAWRTWMEERS